MMKRDRLAAGVILLGMLLLAPLLRAQEVEVQGLFTNAAMLRIDGQQKLLKAGQSHAGVTLISADSQQALVEINGRRHNLGMSRRVSSKFQQPASREVRIQRNQALQYVTNATINGRGVQVMVDTGANIVALNTAQASALGIDWEAGQLARATTAGGVVTAWGVVLNSVDVGGIRVDNVQASVLEGVHPKTILLGMTYLRHVDLEESAGVLVLSRDF
jgi:aspartyl protease family protein